MLLQIKNKLMSFRQVAISSIFTTRENVLKSNYPQTTESCFLFYIVFIISSQSWPHAATKPKFHSIRITLTFARCKNLVKSGYCCGFFSLFKAQSIAYCV